LQAGFNKEKYMEKEIFCKTIKDKAEKINIVLDEKQQSLFWEYMNMLLEWNEKINLTAITEPDEVITKHFVDSMTILKYITNGKSIVDVGTGAGFPGIPLKIANNTLNITLLDSLNKRINFLNETINCLKLESICAVHARVEEFGKNKCYRESFDVATSRAVASLNVLAEYMLPLVKVGGKCICMKGPEIDEEIENSKKAISVLGGKLEATDKIVIPGTDMKRTLIVISKVSATPGRFPRKPGTPAKEPL
jgi:16S rRNA (guanine527-N7)-methyltransferase